MGLYLNPNNSAFRYALNSRIYVDKTGLISYTNNVLESNERNICVSRPRRFGKSMAANMLAAYYGRGCDSRDLFKGLKVESSPSFEEHLNQYDVIYLNIQQFLRKADSLSDLGKCIEDAVIAELDDVYSNYYDSSQCNLPDALATIYDKEAQMNKGFIFIVDEWDCIFREAKEDDTAQKAYLDFLRYLFKDRTYVIMAYMTGILPIKKYGTHSAINIFNEFSMMNPKELAEYVGFTENEVKNLCRQYDMDFEVVQSWYDGYRFADQIHVYNPKSVVDAMLSGELDSYWTETETYEALKIYIDMNYDGLKGAIIVMLGNGRCKINSRKFQNDMTTFKTKDDVLTLLVHLGYLAYNKRKQEVYVPNKEIAAEFLDAIDEPVWDGVLQAISSSEA